MTVENAFSIIFDGPHGKTVCARNPKLEAYKYIAGVFAMDRHNAGNGALEIRGYQIIAHADGAYTVDIAGLMPITYESGN